MSLIYRRPGPRRLEPGLCPGGIIIRIYSVPDEALILERRLSSLAEAEAHAQDDADLTFDIADEVCIVA